MSNLPGLHVLGEANFSDHGANRLGASALMQGLADGYFVLPYTIGNYLATQMNKKVTAERPEFKQVEKEVRDRTTKLLNIKGKKTVTSFHRELGLLMWDRCGMARHADGLKEALRAIPELREEFWKNVNVLGDGREFYNRWNMPAALRIFSSSPSCCLLMRLSAMNRAEVTFESSIKLRKARRCGMMMNFVTWPRGSTTVRIRSRHGTWNRWSSKA